MKLPDHAFTDFAGIKRNFDALVKSVNALIVTDTAYDTRLDTLEIHPAVRVYRNTTTAVATVTETFPSFNTVRYEYGGDLWSGADPQRLYAPRRGIYQAGCHFELQPGLAAATKYSSIHKTGVGVIAIGPDYHLKDADYNIMSLSTHVFMDIGDSVLFSVWQNSGGTVTMSASSAGAWYLQDAYLTFLGPVP